MAASRDGRAMVTGAVILGLVGCGAIPGNREDGRLEATWTGVEKGQMSGKATAVWCRAAKIAQLTAVQGDTGLGLLIRPTDSLKPGQYPIVEPATAGGKVPGATLGLRLLGQVAVVGYQSRSGVLTLEEAGGARLSGRFTATANVATAAAGTISVNGRFLHVPVTVEGSTCPR